MNNKSNLKIHEFCKICHILFFKESIKMSIDFSYKDQSSYHRLICLKCFLDYAMNCKKCDTIRLKFHECG